MQRSTPSCRWSIHDRRGPVQEDISSRTYGAGMEMCSVIAEVQAAAASSLCGPGRGKAG